MDSTETRQFWNGVERRGARPAAERFDELSIDSNWRPTDKKLEASEGWLRANGLIPERRR